MKFQNYLHFRLLHAQSEAKFSLRVAYYILSRLIGTCIWALYIQFLCDMFENPSLRTPTVFHLIRPSTGNSAETFRLPMQNTRNYQYHKSILVFTVNNSIRKSQIESPPTEYTLFTKTTLHIEIIHSS